MAKPTPRQLQILSLLKSIRDSRQRTPSIRELARMIGVRSPNGIAKHLLKLQIMGFITRQYGVMRSVSLVDSQAVPEVA